MVVLPVAAVLALAGLAAYLAMRPALDSAEVAPGTHVNSLGMQFVALPGGEFVMGRDPAREQGDASELPAHRVKVAPFYFGRFEVTQAEFQAVMGYNRSRYPGPRRPADQVTWIQAQEFIAELNRREGGNHYRLPSEAEWEYAARAGASTAWSFGDDADDLGTYAVFGRAGDAGTTPVGLRRPNAWGLYDMHGNVWEWTQDCFHADYTGAPNDARVPMTGDCSRRMVRGGGWNSPAAATRSATRGSYAPDLDDAANGFRLVWMP